MQTIVFSEIVDEKVYRAAVELSEMSDCTVYVICKPDERKVTEEKLCVIEVAERRQEALAEAMSRIEAEQGGIDMLVLSAGRHCGQDGRITDGHNYEALLENIDENVIGNVEVVRAALDLLRKGEGKRIALLTDKASSINLNQGEADYGYLMSQAALHMMEKLLFNELRPEGFTFRCFAMGEGKGVSAAEYLQMNLCYDAGDAYIHSEENRIVMRDEMMREIPW